MIDSAPFKATTRVSYLKSFIIIERKLLNHYFKSTNSQLEGKHDHLRESELIEIVLNIRMFYGVLFSNSTRYLLHKMQSDLEG
jgi:hypothetical protein